MVLTESSVVRAKVSHVRRVPVENRFTYRMDCLLLDETVLGGQRGPHLFSNGRPNLVFLHPSDHGTTGFSGVDGVRRIARDTGIRDVQRVLLLTHPRYWGYAFNPVSFWFLVGAAGSLRAVLAEVHNTFGDRHVYLCAGENDADIGCGDRTGIAKRFHVSPFFDIAGEYRFRFALDESRIAVRIRYDDGAGGGLDTAIAGTRRPFTDRELVKALIRHPLGGLRTTALIHWQAFRLWRKGLPYRRRPEPPAQSVTR